MLKYFDARLLWGIRHFVYKMFCGRLAGIGYLGQPCFAKGLKYLFVGQRFGLFPGWRIEIIGGEVHIGDDVRIGNNVLINCCSRVDIGNNVTFSANVFVGTTDYKISSDLSEGFAQWETQEKPIVIEDNCFVGFGAVLLPGTILRKGCVVGANSVVRGEHPPGTILSGERAQCLRNRV